MQVSPCSGFCCCGAQAVGARASVVEARGLSSCGLWALELSLSSCGAQAYLFCGMWDLPGPGLKPVSPALAGRFLTTAPPGNSIQTFLKEGRRWENDVLFLYDEGIFYSYVRETNCIHEKVLRLHQSNDYFHINFVLTLALRPLFLKFNRHYFCE